MKAIRPLTIKDMAPGIEVIGDDYSMTILQEVGDAIWKAEGDQISRHFFGIDIPFFRIQKELPEIISAVNSIGEEKIQFCLNTVLDYKEVCSQVIEKKRCKEIIIDGFKFDLYRNQGVLMLVSTDLEVEVVYMETKS